MASFFCCQQNSVSSLKNLIKELVVDKELRRWAGRQKEREREWERESERERETVSGRLRIKSFIRKEKHIKQLVFVAIIFAVVKVIVWQAREETQLSVCLWSVVSWGLRGQWRIPSSCEQEELKCFSEDMGPVVVPFFLTFQHWRDWGSISLGMWRCVNG